VQPGLAQQERVHAIGAKEDPQTAQPRQRRWHTRSAAPPAPEAETGAVPATSCNRTAGHTSTEATAKQSEEPSVASASGAKDLLLQPPAVIPEFARGRARGCPALWNQSEGVVYWGRKTAYLCPDYFEPHASVEHVLDFLGVRPGPDGRPVSERLGPPAAQGNCWFRCELRDPGGGSPAPAQPKADGWVRGWHGCKMESVYSILYHGQLCESRDASRGDRFFEGAPGVYLHKDGKYQKAENYMRFVPLFGNGAYYASVFEVYADRSDKVHTFNGTDQWVNRARSVRLGALWLCCRTKQEMVAGDEVAMAWDPELEADPEDWWTCVQDRLKPTLGDWLAQDARPSRVVVKTRHKSCTASPVQSSTDPVPDCRPLHRPMQDVIVDEDAVASCGRPPGNSQESGADAAGRQKSPPPQRQTSPALRSTSPSARLAPQPPLPATPFMAALPRREASKMLPPNGTTLASALPGSHAGGASLEAPPREAEDLTPRAAAVVRRCTRELAVANGIDEVRGFTYSAAKLKRHGLCSVQILAALSDYKWPQDKTGQQVFPGSLRSMIRQQALAELVLDEPSR